MSAWYAKYALLNAYGSLFCVLCEQPWVARHLYSDILGPGCRGMEPGSWSTKIQDVRSRTRYFMFKIQELRPQSAISVFSESCEADDNHLGENTWTTEVGFEKTCGHRCSRTHEVLRIYHADVQSSAIHSYWFVLLGLFIWNASV